MPFFAIPCVSKMRKVMKTLGPSTIISAYLWVSRVIFSMGFIQLCTPPASFLGPIASLLRFSIANAFEIAGCNDLPPRLPRRNQFFPQRRKINAPISELISISSLCVAETKSSKIIEIVQILEILRIFTKTCSLETDIIPWDWKLNHDPNRHLLEEGMCWELKKREINFNFLFLCIGTKLVK